MQKIYMEVAIPLPVKGTFTYTVSGNLIEKIAVGKRVLIPFSKRKLTGYVLRIIPAENRKGLKNIIDISDEYPLFHPDIVEFFEWLADYYHYPIGLIIKIALPSGLNTKVTNSPDMTSKGYLDSVGPLKKIFVSAKTNAGFDLINLSKKNAPKNESEFLDIFTKNRDVLLREITKKFPNGHYLVDKWVKKGFLKKSLKTVVRDLQNQAIFNSPVPPSLNSKQKEAVEKITEKLNAHSFFTYLLHGVTGSGKTEVYYRAILASIALGRQSILMVPEIALTFSLASLFKARLGDKVSILHSAISIGEKYDQWLKIAKGEIDLVIGTRSALFAPLPKLGLIIIDEEHDLSYKQEERFRYQARDSAIVRAKALNALAILGSGTPSIQSYKNSLNGKYELLTMPERILKKKLPDITIIDMRRFENNKKHEGIISPPLKKAIGENFAEKNQTILFLNRRGFNVLYLCRLCGEPLKCPNCEVSLTYHKYKNKLVCHYCGYRTDPPDKCPSCNSKNLVPYGFGTERVVEIVRDMFQDARIERMDRDTMRHRGNIQQVLKRLHNHEMDILVGTQMITKGHDFPGVTLVGVISADLSLNWPDFRAGEITFQVLSQVAGRTGRGSLPGRVLIQTYNPSHYTIIAAKDHDYEKFFMKEINLRHQLNYPPFSFLANLKLLGNNNIETEKIAQHVRNALDEILETQYDYKKNIDILGPVEAPVAKIKGKYRQQILIKSKRPGYLNLLLKDVDRVTGKILSSTGVNLIIDIDPYQMM
ncbi:MAG: primosomal protein N' [Thermodesulfobacteriota bacterium]|nr:primosomal protein N' [Thermodesulfobacteriota bacterium]